MAILDSFQTVADGDQLNDGFFNGISRLVGTDTTGGASGSTGSFVKIGEVAVGAGEVVNDITLSTLLTVRAGYDEGSATNYLGEVEIRIGETGSETNKQSLTWRVTDSQADNLMSSQIEFYYAPTASEKANGFNVQIYGKGTTDAQGTSEVTCEQLIVRREI